jgi:hypothetical protein
MAKKERKGRREVCRVVKVKMEARARRFRATRGTLMSGGQERVTHLPPSFETHKRRQSQTRLLARRRRNCRPSSIAAKLPHFIALRDIHLSPTAPPLKLVAVVSCLFILGQLSRLGLCLSSARPHSYALPLRAAYQNSQAQAPESKS